MKLKQAFAFIVAILFAGLAGLALYFFATTTVVPPTYEAYTAYKEFGGNGSYITGLGFLAFLAGFASLIALGFAVFGTSEQYR